ncbi:cx9C motif-containing protein 4-like [Varroa jacobsoni]|uniref:cx9C motif-containing protein 4-like n=1 Tax=Varroa jacobsoni TaxID=62625 RepID=UPI000BF5E8DD|nr:cx9C motif-containing protein 4-like [Varroa jacobsoni]
MPLGDPCQKQACDIQRCLQANHYKEALCTEAFRAMDKCCEKWAEKSGCCAGFLKDQQLKKKTAKSTTSL